MLQVPMGAQLLATSKKHSRTKPPASLRQDTYSKAVELTPGLQSLVLLKMGGRRFSICD